MIILLGKDPWTFVSLIGISMIAVVQWITDHINPIVATISLLLGVVLLCLGIMEKWLIVKAKWEQAYRNKGKK
ncbi:MAG TPA: hypothetical protein VGK46_14690 [Saprospiraceae bacterium]